MSLDRTVAHFVTYRRRLVFFLTCLLALASALVIVFGVHFASDVLDLLPQNFDSVRGFKTFDREFAQAREITFGLLDETGEVDLEAFAEHFATALRAELWVVRVMDRSPLETPAGVQEVQTIAAPLLLNLEPAAFEEALAALDPDTLSARLKKLRAAMEAGSPKAEFELDFDPLGLVTPAMKPLAGSFSVEQTQPLVSPDGTLRLVFVVTNQADLSARTCQEMMRQVNDFRVRVLAAWPDAKPQILATGRTAYVGELSLVMRGDIISTIPSSVILVSVVFWFGFRRLRPLVSLVNVLLLASLIAIAIGALVFRELNMITIGLCSILMGVGEDFGMMLYAIYQAEREDGHDHETAIAAAIRHHASAIVYGAATTAAGFLCLLLTGTAGFAQLGVLVAAGIFIAAGLSITVFFLFIGKKHRPRPRSRLRAGSEFFIRHTYAGPLRLFVPAALVLVGLCAYAFTPAGRIHFDADPKSLEPKDSRAGTALRTISAKMTGSSQPVLAIVRAPSAEEFHRRWQRLNEAWTAHVHAGRLKAVNSPAAFALSPARVEQNSARLAGVDFARTHAALSASIAAEGLNAASFQPAFAFLGALERIARGEKTALDWRTSMPANSAWWFVLDRFFGRSPNVGVAYIQPAHKITSPAGKEATRELLAVPGIDVQLTGWAYALQDIVPWSKSKLAQLSAAMLTLNIVILFILCRRIFPVVLLMSGLILAVGATVATLHLLGVSLDLFNVLAFPLILGVGVDYGIYVILAMRAEDPRRELVTIVKPVLLSGLTTVAGFGSLVTANNPALRGLGTVCAWGVAWSIFATFFFILPACVWRVRR